MILTARPLRGPGPRKEATDTMQTLRKLLRSALNFGKSKIGARIDEISTGLEEENVPQVIINSIVLILAFGIGLFASIFLVRFIITHLHLFIIGAFLASALYSVSCKFLGIDVDDGSGIDSSTIELAEQEAQEVHEELRELVYNAVAEAAEYTPLQRPRDVYSIETSREKPYRMDGAMAVHQFEADFSGTLDRSKLDSLFRDVQRRINKHARRYPGLVRDGHPPILYDIKDNGSFLLLEVVLYAKDHSGKIEARKRARIERQHGQERIDDPRYQ